MASQRIEQPGPFGGKYQLAVYVKRDTLEEVTQSEATGVIITEYDADDQFLGETIGHLTPSQSGP